MYGSSLYGVLELEDTRFNMCAMVEETREFKTDSFVRSYQLENSWFVREKREIQEINIQ